MATALASQVELKQYFTDALEINFAMAELLGNVQDLTLLEPSVGNGALLSGLIGAPRSIDAVDVDASLLSQTKRRFPMLNINTLNVDFVDVFVREGRSDGKDSLRPHYDAVISNPPYGLYFSSEFRKQLKTVLPGMYVRESYGLFLIFALMKLTSGGRYVLLLPDTFLTSTNHSPLRRYIMEQGQPSHIVRFPSKRFKTINFGYGNLCIIAGNKNPLSDQSSTKWIEAFNNDLPLLRQPIDSTTHFTMTDLESNISSGWRTSMSDNRSGLKNWTTLGEVASCKTGIYSGDNVQFIGFDPSRINKRLNGHSIDWKSVHDGSLTDEEQRCGLSGNRMYVPFIRGGHRCFDEKTAWAIRWDVEAIKFYKTNKKARLQNTQYYFKPGLAVPMVTARRLSASLMGGAVFDQGVVGVFPRTQDSLEAILLYLNSTLATSLRNEIVNGGANNSANYLKRLPIPFFEKSHLLEAKSIVSKAIDQNSLPLEACDKFVHQFITKQDT